MSISVIRANAGDRDAVRALEHAAAVVHGHATLGAAVWRDLEQPRPDSAGFFARSHEGGHLGYVHVARSDTFEAVEGGAPEPTAPPRASTTERSGGGGSKATERDHADTPPHWAVGIVLQPRVAPDPTNVLLEAAVKHARSYDSAALVAWRFDPSATDDTDMATAGFAAERDLYQMRVQLPLDPKLPRGLPSGYELRTFTPGVDNAAWLSVNNRAFGSHPEQGGWIEATLDRRLAEPWFDPALFLLADDEHGLAGFNWLKVHDSAVGEIFVIGVDPRTQGSGLGRALAIEGLDRLAARGIGTGMLYVAAENAAALGLYRSLGFTVSRVDRAYRYPTA